MAKEKVLVVQLRQLGDILLTTPCFREIKKHWPDSHLTFFSHAMGRQIVENNPYVDEHFTYSDKQNYVQMWNLALELKNRKYDLVLDFMNNPRSAFYTWMTRSPRRCSYQSSRSWAYNEIIKRQSGEKYIVDEKFDILRFAGFHPEDKSLILPWTEHSTGPLFKLLGHHQGFKDAKIRVALSPTHRRSVRKWPGHCYVKLADELTTKWQAEVMWVWGPGEYEEVESLAKACSHSTLMAPSTTIPELAALLANCDLFVGNSNGPSHVAVAADVCSLQLHGPTSAKSWCPMTDRHRAIQSPDRQHPEAIHQISFEEVVSHLEQFKPIILAESQARRSGAPKTQWQEN